MTWESEKCQTCGGSTTRGYMECDVCGKRMKHGAPHWTLGASCPEDDSSDACSHECALKLIRSLTWDGMRGIELEYRGTRKTAAAMLERLVGGDE